MAYRTISTQNMNGAESSIRCPMAISNKIILGNDFYPRHKADKMFKNICQNVALCQATITKMSYNINFISE